jgi:hypothetical protein
VTLFAMLTHWNGDRRYARYRPRPAPDRQIDEIKLAGRVTALLLGGLIHEYSLAA